MLGLRNDVENVLCDVKERNLANDPTLTHSNWCVNCKTWKVFLFGIFCLFRSQHAKQYIFSNFFYVFV